MWSNVVQFVNEFTSPWPLHKHEAKFVADLQRSKLPPSALFFASHLGDPPAVNLIAFPLAFFFHPVLGVATLLSINFSEWINCVLKWILMGDRPYWWVKEHPKAGVTLRQFPITCETGPGSPSGHCMAFVAGWLPLMLFLAHHRWPSYKLALYCLGCFCTATIGISRLYVAAHFPHQVIGGIFAGMAVGLVMYCWAMAYLTDLEARSPFGRRSFYDQRPSPLLCPWRLCLVAVALFAVGKAMGYFLIQVAGVDVHTSMRLATRHCDQPNWIHSSTSVMASYARVSGTILGLAFALALRPLMPHCSPLASQTLKRVVLSSSISVVLVSVLKVVAVTSTVLLRRLLTLPLLALGGIDDVSLLISTTLYAALCPIVVAFVFPTCFSRACIRNDAFFESFRHDSATSLRPLPFSDEGRFPSSIRPHAASGMLLRNGVSLSSPQTQPLLRRRRSRSAARK